MYINFTLAMENGDGIHHINYQMPITTAFIALYLPASMPIETEYRPSIITRPLYSKGFIVLL